MVKFCGLGLHIAVRSAGLNATFDPNAVPLVRANRWDGPESDRELLHLARHPTGRTTGTDQPLGWRLWGEPLRKDRAPGSACRKDPASWSGSPTKGQPMRSYNMTPLEMITSDWMRSNLREVLDRARD